MTRRVFGWTLFIYAWELTVVYWPNQETFASSTAMTNNMLESFSPGDLDGAKNKYAIQCSRG
jgi:hypothetical protein